jgi:putative DNA primase/helicase
MKLKSLLEESQLPRLNRYQPANDTLDPEDDPFAPDPLPVKKPSVSPVANLGPVMATKVSSELQFSQFMSLSDQYRSSSCGENLFLYQWQQNHWGKCMDTTGHKMAWTWLKLNAPKEAKANKAESLYKTALLDLPPLPGLPRQSMIPLSNVWLVVHDDGRLEIQQPDPNWGVTYFINARLPVVQGESYYQPQPLQEGGYFDDFLRMSLPNEQERQLVQEYCGYTLLNDVRFQCCQVWVGNGRNGKSVLMKIMEQLHSKVGTIDLDDLSGFGLSALVDASLIVCPETPKRGIDEQTFKRIVSGDSIAVSYKYKDAFRYNPMAKLIVACNRFPHFTDDSNGVWRRIQIVHWSVDLKKEQQIGNLDSKIIANELDQVVNWCLEGLVRLLKRGDFEIPRSVEDRQLTERISSNNIMGFIDESGLQVSSTGEQTEKSKIYQRYQEFCGNHGLVPYHGNEFWKRVAQQFSGLHMTKKTIRNSRVMFVNLEFDITDDEPVGEVPEFDGEKGGRHG